MAIFVSGYWNQNLGDDLFLHLLCQHYPEFQFRIICGHQAFKPLADIKNLDNLPIPLKVKIATKVSALTGFSNTKLLDELQIHAANKSEAYVELGGSLFKLPLHGMGHQFFLRQKILSLQPDYYVLGSNFGPYYQQLQVGKYSHLFQQMSHVTFRDKYSLNLFSGLTNISWAPDLAFVLDTKPYQQAANYTLISVINPTKRFDHATVNDYYNFLIRYTSYEIKCGHRVVLMAFCRNEGDLKTANLIKSHVNSQQVSTYVHYNLTDSLSMIAQAKKVVATRYHAMILGWLFNKPTFVLSYSQKINHVISDIFPQQPLAQIANVKQIAPEKVKFDRPLNLKSVIEEAKKQFTATDQRWLR